MADFLLDQNITDFFNKIYAEFALTDIPAFVRDAAYQEIVQVTEVPWELSAQTLYVDGRGVATIFCPVLPIISLTELVVIDKNTNETSLIVDQTDEDRQVWYDGETGFIKLIKPIAGIEWGTDDDADVGIFPSGVQNIKIVGTFGTDQPKAILTLLQLYIMLRHMSKMDPDKYGSADIISERIGKYQYTLSSGGSGANSRMSLDTMIEHLYEVLPRENSLLYEDI